jgi:hypothetical protein
VPPPSLVPANLDTDAARLKLVLHQQSETILPPFGVNYSVKLAGR